MLQISFDRLIASHWEAVEMDCLTFEKKGNGIDLQLTTKKSIYIESVRNIKVFDSIDMEATERKWKEGTAGLRKPSGLFHRSEQNYLTKIGVDDGKISDVKYDPNILTCSFCGSKVDRIRATFGLGRIEVGKEYQKTSDPTYYTLVTHVGVKKVIACPSCCLEVKPIMHKVLGADGKEHLEIKAQNCTTYSGG